MRGQHRQDQHLQAHFHFRGIVLRQIVSRPPLLSIEAFTRTVPLPIVPEKAIMLICLSFNTLLEGCERRSNFLGPIDFLPHTFTSAFATILHIYRLLDRGSASIERLRARGGLSWGAIVFVDLRRYCLQFFMVHLHKRASSYLKLLAPKPPEKVEESGNIIRSTEVVTSPG